MKDLTIRTAGAHELEEIVSIDDDACTLYAEWGLDLALPATHPFLQEERMRWMAALQSGSTYLALDDTLKPVGFCALTLLDDAAYLEQISVRRSAMRRGVGRRLLQTAISWARFQNQRALTLITYSHLAFNRPLYTRHGFEALAPSELTPGLAGHLEHQRQHLPRPEERVAMQLVL